MNKISTDKEARGVLADGRYLADESLWLTVRGSSRSWVVRANGRDYSIGSLKKVSLALARKQADKILASLRNGVDPVDEKRAAAAAAARRKTFAEAAQAVIATRSPSWRTSFDGRASTATQWAHDMTVDCAPIADLDVASITIEQVKAIVAPYWDRGHLDRARMLLGRIEMVFNYAKAHGWRTADNPASWAVFEHLSPKAPRGDDPHHAALDWRAVPDLMARLAQSDAVGARLVEFIILTASRSGEARGARWDEIQDGVWTVPADRMKKGKTHAVPLSRRAQELLQGMEKTGDYVFAPRGEPMSNAGVWAFVKRATGGADATTHGFRSAFKDWANNQGFDHLLSERALAHDVGDATVTAYARDTLTELRRPMMEAWADYLAGVEAPTNVVPLRRSA